MSWSRIQDRWERAYYRWLDVKAVIIIIIVALAAIGAFVLQKLSS